MSRSGRIVPSVIGAVVVITGVTVAVTRPWDTATASSDQHGFVRHADAVDFPPVVPGTGTDAGTMIGLVPYGACAIGLGDTETTAIEPTYWSGSGDCARFGMATPNAGEAESDSGPSSSHFGGSFLSDAVTTADGSMIVIGEDQEHNDYNSSIGEVYSLSASGLNLRTRLDPPENAGKQWQDQRGQVMFGAVAQAGGTLLIGGRQSTPTSEGRPKIWTSTDGGRTLNPIELPEPPKLVAGVQAMAVHGNTVVALGTETGDETHETLVGWVSGDQGRTWASIGRQSFAANSVRGIAFANGQWFAAGDTQGARMPEPVVLTSQDAVHWQATSLPAEQGGGDVAGLTVDGAGSPIVVGWTGPPPSGSDDARTECGAIWLATPPATWTDVNTGCGGATPTGVVTLSDGRVLVTSDHDVWIRARRQRR